MVGNRKVGVLFSAHILLLLVLSTVALASNATNITGNETTLVSNVTNSSSPSPTPVPTPGAMYNFGTMQKGNAFVAEPGTTLKVVVYFYMDEVYGNRNAHVTVWPENTTILDTRLKNITLPTYSISLQNVTGEDNVTRLVNVSVKNGTRIEEQNYTGFWQLDSASDWVVSVTPGVKPVKYNVSGVVTIVNESLVVMPRPVIRDLPAVNETGYAYLVSPSGLGYLQAKPVVVEITIPADAVLGETYGVLVAAKAEYLTQGGNMAWVQLRDFFYKITVMNFEYTEQPVESPTPIASPSPTPTGVVGGNWVKENIGGIAIAALGGVVLGAGYYFVSKQKQRDVTKKKEDEVQANDGAPQNV